MRLGCVIKLHAPERVPIIYYGIKHGYIIMFYLDFNTTVPLQRVALVIWKAYVDIIDIIRSCKFYFKTTEPSSKIKCSSSRTKTSEILKSYSHFKIGSHPYYICFCFTLTVLFMHTMFLYKKTKQYLTRYRAHYKI